MGIGSQPRSDGLQLPSLGLSEMDFRCSARLSSLGSEAGGRGSVTGTGKRAGKEEVRCRSRFSSVGRASGSQIF